MNKRIYGKIASEGDELFYKITGDGIPLILIPGGGGDGDSFLPLADSLRDKFKVITYDRRANARSTANNPNSFSIAQQCRDVLAVLKAAGDWTVHKNVWFAEVARHLSDNIGSKFIILPGAHVSFMDRPKKWAEILNNCYR